MNARKRKKRKKTKILKKIEAGELGLDVLPRSREVEYCDRFSKITAMLPADRSTTTISYEDLLKLHMAPVHIDDHELCLMECLMSCSQKQMCRNIRNALRIAEFIKEQLGVKDRLFKTLQKPNVVGSLRENSRLFSLDEMDATLILGDELSQYLHFNSAEHTVEIRNIPANHPLADYMDADQCFDLKNYVERYFALVHSILLSMESRWPEELSDIRLHNFTTRYTPCARCMDTEWSRTQVVRCHHDPACHHHGPGLQQCPCRGVTSLSISVSKIGKFCHVEILKIKASICLFFMLTVAVLHLAFIMDDGSLHYMDMDLSVPTFKTSNTEDFDGHSNDYMFWLGRNKPSGWREEVEKLDYMSASIDKGAEKFIKIRMINRDTVVPSQVFSGKRQT